MANIILDGRREEKLKAFMERTISGQDHLDWSYWDGYVEEDVLDAKELAYMREKYKVVVTLEKK